MSYRVERIVDSILELGVDDLSELRIRLARVWGDDPDAGAGAREPREPLPRQPGGTIAHPLPVDPRLVKYRPGWP